MPSLWMRSTEGTLVPMEAEGYASESEFQTLLADNPAVLASAIDGSDGNRWLLIDQELPIKAEEGETGTWKLDHLFVASDGTPVLVEVKRSSDPRARRTVVGQMLDYAASFAIDWSADRLRMRREARLASTSPVDRQSEMDEFLSDKEIEGDEQLWSAVQEKIDAGRIRLLLVADALSPALVQIVEYLNGQLKDAEVLGVEVVRHASTTGAIAYQPVVRGRASPAARSKAPAQRQTLEHFEAKLVEHQGEGVLAAVNALIDQVRELGGYPSVGTSAENPALYLNFRSDGAGAVYWPMLITPRLGKLIVRITKLSRHPAFEDPDVRDELLGRVAAAAGSPMQGNPDGAPWVPVSVLTGANVLNGLVDVLTWVKSTADAVTGVGQATAGGNNTS